MLCLAPLSYIEKRQKVGGCPLEAQISILDYRLSSEWINNINYAKEKVELRNKVLSSKKIDNIK